MAFSLSDLFGGTSNEVGGQAANPGSPVSGATSWGDVKSAVSGLKNTLEGDPASATAALAKMQQQAYAQGSAIKDFLMGQKAQSEKYYQPMQQMFTRMYGNGGITPLKAPSVPGSMPIGGAGGGPVAP